MFAPYQDFDLEEDVSQRPAECGVGTTSKPGKSFPIEIILCIAESLNPVSLVSLLYALPSLAPLLTVRHAAIRDSRRRTVLHYLAGKGETELMSVLLANNAFVPDVVDMDGRTPLLYGAFMGNEASINCLLRKDVNVNWTDLDGFTALFWAVDRCHNAVAKLLVSREDVDVNMRDHTGRTALHEVLFSKNAAVAEILLSREDIDVNVQDEAGQSPLSLAAEYGYQRAVELLLERSDVFADRKDYEGRTPLWWATANGHGGVVKLLLTRTDVDMNSKDMFGQTPYSVAADGNNGAARLLLEHGAEWRTSAQVGCDALS